MVIYCGYILTQLGLQDKYHLSVRRTVGTQDREYIEPRIRAVTHTVKDVNKALHKDVTQCSKQRSLKIGTLDRVEEESR